MPTAYTTFEEEAKKLIDPNREKAKLESNAFYDSQVASTNKLYDAEAEKAGKAYEDSYRENAVQKLINERQVAENMANLGLTNSGLNRTQQTAVQLSYANQKANIDRQKQNNIDDINLNRTKALDTIEQNRLSSDASIDQEYDKLINETATANYKNYLSEQDKITQKQSESPKISKFDYGTPVSMSYSSNGNVLYTDESGNSVKMRAGANPYTGDVNADLLVNGEYNASRAFSNGYQPKYYKGKELTYYTPSKGSKETSTANVPWRDDGKQQQIFTTGKNKYYVWYGPNNRYVEARWNNTKKCWEFNLD